MQAVPILTEGSKTLSEFYSRIRSFTGELCKPLEIEDYIPQPTIDVSPPKWNIAHTTWFFEEMILKKYAADYRVFDERFGFLFNSYYNSIGERTSRDHRGDLSRPTVKNVFEYRKHVDAAMAKLLAGDLSGELRDLVILGLNHEQQHQELFLTDLKFTFSTNPLDPAYREGFAPSEIAESKRGGMTELGVGEYTIGFSGEGFCFDNELRRHEVRLDDFGISENLVTNNEFAEFIEDGGYGDFRLWHSDGWDWLRENRVESPLYWRRADNEWLHFTLGGLRTLPPAAPVCHVSYYEASAFAEWSGKRLPTEFEWEAASGRFDWGLRWEWTNSAYLPYPGFAKAAGAVGEYNGKFMINQMVLRGASVVTPVGHSRNTYRNFFQPQLRWQFTGIRLAK
ncbi:MAG: ergothioneine biosynthesis protein EgtB [Pyrinomonadaceae bacterium]